MPRLALGDGGGGWGWGDGDLEEAEFGGDGVGFGDGGVFEEGDEVRAGGEFVEGEVLAHLVGVVVAQGGAEEVGGAGGVEGDGADVGVEPTVVGEVVGVGASGEGVERVLVVEPVEELDVGVVVEGEVEHVVGESDPVADDDGDGLAFGGVIEPVDGLFGGGAGGELGEELGVVADGESGGAPVDGAPGGDERGPGEDGGDGECGGGGVGESRELEAESREEVSEEPGGGDEEGKETEEGVAGEEDSGDGDEGDELGTAPDADEEEGLPLAAVGHPEETDGGEEEEGRGEVEVEPAFFEGVGGIVGPPLGVEIGARGDEGDEVFFGDDPVADGGVVLEDGLVEDAGVEVLRVVGEEDGNEEGEGEECGEGVEGEEAAEVGGELGFARVDEECGGGEDPEGVTAVLLGDEEEGPGAGEEEGCAEEDGARGVVGDEAGEAEREPGDGDGFEEEEGFGEGESLVEGDEGIGDEECAEEGGEEVGVGFGVGVQLPQFARE